MDDQESAWEDTIEDAEKALAEERFSSAQEALFRAMELAYEFGEADNRFVYTLDKLAECLWYQGQLDEAENYCKQLIRIHESVLDEDPINISSFFNNLALLKHAARSFNEAEKYYRRALKGKERGLGANHPDVLRIKSNYADMLRVMGRDEDAQAMSTSTRVVTVRDWQSSTVSRHLRAEKENAKARKAERQLEQKRVDDWRDLNERKNVMLSVDEVLLLWQSIKHSADQARKDDDEANCEKLWNLALKLLETVADNSVELTYTLDTLAQMAHSKQDYDAAITFNKRSYELKLSILGTRNVLVAQSADMLARLYYLVSDYDGAEPYAKECLDFYERVNETGSVEAGCALHNLATLYHVQRKYEQAEPLYKSALDIKSKALGPDHPDTLRLLRSYGHVLSSMHKQSKIDSMNAQMITGSWKAITVGDTESLLVSD
ncbi:MAG: tetratricopeptide repeat protein [Candidatus Obscuribacterales bacterium]|nr:tetratricopeptide repeat protein [Candidatus Obscuribacterales bacterium]